MKKIYHLTVVAATSGTQLLLLLSLATPLSLAAEEHAYPAFSPDGRYLVFSSDARGNHDLYRADSNGERVLRLTSSTGSETQATWSPDGSQIAYVHRPWNPSSRSRLFVMDRDGKNPQRVGDLQGVHLPAWGDDGRIHFSMRVGGQSDIFSATPDGTDLVNHTDTPGIDEANVDLHDALLVYDRPDGDHHAIEILDLERGTRRLFKTAGIYWDPQWTPDGTRLLIGAYAEGSGFSRIRDFELSGEAGRWWTPAAMNAFWPTVSPDGNTVVFSYADREFGVGTLHALDLDTGSVRPFLKLYEQ